MDLVTSVMSVLMPYVAKAAEEFITHVGKDAYEKAKKLFATLKTRFAGDKEAIDQLAYFEKNPQRYESLIEDILEKKLAQDKELATELAEILDEMGPTLEIIQKFGQASGITGLKAKHLKKGKVKIIQEGDKITEGKGADIGTIGQ